MHMVRSSYHGNLGQGRLNLRLGGHWFEFCESGKRRRGTRKGGWREGKGERDTRKEGGRVRRKEMRDKDSYDKG